MTRSIFLLIIITNGLMLGSIHAQGLATMPYRELVRMAFGDINQNLSDKSFKMVISSRLGVPPEQIRLVLEAEPDPQFLLVDEKGVFEVPNDPKLLTANPMLVTNQPRGSLDLRFNIPIPNFQQPKIVNGKVSYKELFQPVLRMQEEVRKRGNPTFGLVGNDQFVLEIKTTQSVKLIRKMGAGQKSFSGSRIFIPDSEGVIMMVMDAYMFEDNPDILVPAGARINAVPVSPGRAEQIKKSY